MTKGESPVATKGAPHHVGPLTGQFFAGHHLGNHQTRAMGMGDLAKRCIRHA